MLKRVRAALMNRDKDALPLQQPEQEKDVYTRPEGITLLELFARQFSQNKGRFVYCENPQELVEQLRALIQDQGWERISTYEPPMAGLMDELGVKHFHPGKDPQQVEVGITQCEALIARLGALLLTSTQNRTRVLSAYPPVHVVVASSHQLVYDLDEALEKLREQHGEDFPGMTSLVAGPSRTADIEKTLVLGAHGPKELYVFYMENEA